MAAPSRPGAPTDPIVTQPIAPDKSIDCIGFFCPIPILKIREAMKSLVVGQILEIRPPAVQTPDGLRAQPPELGQAFKRPLHDPGLRQSRPRVPVHEIE